MKSHRASAITEKKRTTKSPTTKTNSYHAFSFHQTPESALQLLVFVAPAGEILEWATVDELLPAAQTRGPQRELRDSRVEAIRNFLAVDPRNTIPSAVTLAFTKGKATFTPSKKRGRNDNGVSGGELSVVVDRRSATIVDGQHRLNGIRAFGRNTQVAVVALLDADRVEQAFQFLVINNKSTRVSVKHIKALLARNQDSELHKRLLAARIAFDSDGIKDVNIVNTDKESPFYKTIDWTTTPPDKRMVPATAVESSLDYIEGLDAPGLGDRDVRRAVFLAMWARVKKAWPQLWHPGSRLVSKVGVICLTRCIMDFVVTWADSDQMDIDLSNLADIDTNTAAVLRHMNPAFWTAPWADKAQGGFDTNQGRDRVLSAIKQLYRNGKGEIEWHTGIDIIDSTEPAEPRARTPRKS